MHVGPVRQLTPPTPSSLPASMTWKNVKLIFLRELRDQLRDRRTLFMVAVLPLLLYPALGVGMTSMTVNFSELERTVAIIGAADLPPPPLLDPKQPDRFLAEYFDVASDVDKLRVITESTLKLPLEPGIPDELQERQRAFVKQAFESRALLEQLGTLSRARQAAEDRALRLSYLGPEKKAEHDACLVEARTIETQESKLRSRVNEWFLQSPVEVLVVIPTDSPSRSKRPTASWPTARIASPAMRFPSPSSCRTVLTRSPRSHRDASRMPCRAGKNACAKHAWSRQDCPVRCRLPWIRPASNWRPRKTCPPTCGASSFRPSW